MFLTKIARFLDEHRLDIFHPFHAYTLYILRALSLPSSVVDKSKKKKAPLAVVSIIPSQRTNSNFLRQIFAMTFVRNSRWLSLTFQMDEMVCDQKLQMHCKDWLYCYANSKEGTQSADSDGNESSASRVLHIDVYFSKEKSDTIRQWINMFAEASFLIFKLISFFSTKKLNWIIYLNIFLLSLKGFKCAPNKQKLNEFALLVECNYIPADDWRATFFLELQNEEIGEGLKLDVFQRRIGWRQKVFLLLHRPSQTIESIECIYDRVRYEFYKKRVTIVDNPWLC